MTASEDRTGHVALNRRYWDENAAAWHGPLARGHWSRTEQTWGLWNTPESQVGLFPDGVAGMGVVELGCGTAYVSAWLARAGARPVGIDLSGEQLATARSMQREFGIDFPLVLADAERLPLQDAAFDLAISEFGASLWCDPYRWIPEAARVLRPGGRLVFVRRSRGSPSLPNTTRCRTSANSSKCNASSPCAPSRTGRPVDRASQTNSATASTKVSASLADSSTSTSRWQQSRSQGPWPTGQPCTSPHATSHWHYATSAKRAKPFPRITLPDTRRSYSKIPDCEDGGGTARGSDPIPD